MIVIGLMHIAISSVLVWFLAALNGAMAPWLASLALAIGFTMAIAIGPRMQESFAELALFKFSPRVNGVIEKAIFIFVCYLGYRHFAYLLYTANGGISTLSANNYGDLPLHINYIRQIASGDVFPPFNPEYGLERLRYPLGVDLYSSLWESLGVLTQAHFFLFGLFATIVSLVVLRAWGGWWAMGGFFLSGSWISWQMLNSGQLLQLQTKISWKNLFLSVFITQRGMLFALPVGLLLLHFVRKVFIDRIAPNKTQYFGFGFLWGSLALFHIHSFFAVTLLLVGLIAIYADRTEAFDFIRRLAITAVPIGTFFTLYSTGFLKKASIVHWRAGWMAEPGQLFSFMATNFGPYLLFAIALPIAISGLKTKTVSKENQKLLAEWALYIALFTLFFNVMLAPWEWDNVKVLIWPYLGLLALARTVFQRFEKQSWYGTFQVASFAALCLCGTATVIEGTRTLNSAVRIFSLSDLADGEGATKHAPTIAVFAAAPTHDHVLTWLGRRRTLGYDGHLWSHGIDAHDASADLVKLMKGEEEWFSAAVRLGVTHIFWGPAERNLYGVTDPVWRQTLKNISPVKGYEVYEVLK